MATLSCRPKPMVDICTAQSTDCFGGAASFRYQTTAELLRVSYRSRSTLAYLAISKHLHSLADLAPGSSAAVCQSRCSHGLLAASPRPAVTGARDALVRYIWPPSDGEGFVSARSRFCALSLIVVDCYSALALVPRPQPSQPSQPPASQTW